MNWPTKAIRMVLVVLAGAAPALAGTSERVVSGRFSGVAIGGIDPVGIFVDGSVAAGFEQFELAHDGAIWRFRNSGNRASFAARPDIYAPQFGGYDPLALVGGAPRPGRPQLWAIVHQRLYLFADEASRAAFLAAPQAAVSAARAAWPNVEATLAR